MQTDYDCTLASWDWYALEKLLTQPGKASGVYRVHAAAWDGARVNDVAGIVPVSRLLGSDRAGRLYIGMTKNLLHRFTTLIKAIKPDYVGRDGHGFARVWWGSPAIRQRFPHLCFSVRFCDDATVAEAGELAAYRTKFGELLPFNALAGSEATGSGANRP
jgi:hypothetical protein